MVELWPTETKSFGKISPLLLASLVLVCTEWALNLLADLSVTCPCRTFIPSLPGGRWQPATPRHQEALSTCSHSALAAPLCSSQVGPSLPGASPLPSTLAAPLEGLSCLFTKKTKTWPLCLPLTIWPFVPFTATHVEKWPKSEDSKWSSSPLCRRGTESSRGRCGNAWGWLGSSRH